MRIVVSVLFILLLDIGQPTKAEVSLKFVGVQGAKAALLIDSRMHSMTPGQEINGIRLLAATGKDVIVRIDGRTFLYKRGATRGKELPTELSIGRRYGMFLIRGQINGHNVDFLIDTGASHVVLSAEQARKIGLRYRTNKPIQVTTASRTEIAYEIILTSVGIGGIFRNDVPAVVTRGNFPEVTLLGMSFLRQLAISQDGEQMTITE